MFQVWTSVLSLVSEIDCVTYYVVGSFCAWQEKKKEVAGKWQEKESKEKMGKCDLHSKSATHHYPQASSMQQLLNSISMIFIHTFIYSPTSTTH